MAITLGTQAATAQEDGSGKSFSRIDTSIIAKADGKGPGFTPGLLAGKGRIKVILRTAGDSVGVRMYEAKAAGDPLGEAELAAARASLKESQEATIAALRDLDAKILGRYQDAYNGVAASVPRKHLLRLEGLPNVVAVHPAKVIERANTAGARFIQAHQAWTDLGLTGKGIKIGILDTGIDYTHANFGGPGTEEAFETAQENDTTLADGLFPTAKVAGGFDFVGDDFNASATDEEIATDPNVVVPQPDPDPLDCNGHGSHVAGSAAGMGVLNGETYTGPYTAAAMAAFPSGFPRDSMGPGVAPEATLYAYRVFGCSGSTTSDVLVAALDRALEDGVDVVNMSLGSVFGRPGEPDAVASNTLALAGVAVVASAGNSGSGAYITGAPGIASRALSVTAVGVSSEFFPGECIALPAGEPVQAISANGLTLPAGTTLEVKVLRNEDGTVSLGCDPDDYVDVAGKLVVTVRGVCARVARAIYGQQAGAAAVVMINNAATLPPFEGEITSNPDTGEPFVVTIPFLGVRGVLGPSPFDDGDRLVAADGQMVTLTPAQVTNPGFRTLATFTSGGGRNVDSAAKPDVAAPGVSVISTDIGTGFKAAAISGTSMAAPLTAGVAALVTQAHPDWATARIKAAIMNTADPTRLASGYDPRRAGSGVVNARRAVDTVGLALAGTGQSSLNFFYRPLLDAFEETRTFTLVNTGPVPLTYDLTADFVGGNKGAELSFPNSVAVPAQDSVRVEVTVSMSKEALAALPPAEASLFGALAQHIRGAITATPRFEGAGVYPLRMPFMFVPRGLSNVIPNNITPFTFEGEDEEFRFATTLPVTNHGIHAGAADIYAWGIRDADDTSGAEDSMDVRAVGVQSLPRGFLCGNAPVGACGTENDRSLIFAINVYGRWTNPSTNEFDIAIYVGDDPQPSFFVVGVDIGAVLAGSFDGRYASIIFNAEGQIVNAWVADAPMNGSTMLLPTLASDIGLTAAPGTGTPTLLRYAVGAFSIVPENLIDITDFGMFRLDRPAVSSGEFVPLEPGESASIPLGAHQPTPGGTLGWMVVTMDDPNGPPQADLLGLPQGAGELNGLRATKVAARGNPG